MRIFLSYSRSDQAIVERIRASLNAAGFEAFLDTKDLPLGQEYNARIKLAVVILDRETSSSGQLRIQLETLASLLSSTSLPRKNS